VSVAAGSTTTRQPTPDPDVSVAATAGGGTVVAGGRRAATGVVPAYLVCFLAFIPANMFSANSRLLGFPIGPDRLLLGAGLILLVVDARPWSRVRLRWRGVHTLLLVFLAWVVVSAVWFGSWRARLAQFAVLDRLLVPFVLFAIAPVIFGDRRSRDLLIKTLAVLAIYLGFTAVFEIVGPHALVFPRYILDPSVGIQFGRARGPFVESEADGMTMAMAAFAAGLGLARFRGGWRLVCALACGIAAVGVLLTLTRSVWIGASAAVLAMFILAPALRKFLIPLVISGVIGVLALLATVPGLSDSVSGRADSAGPVYDRLNTNAAALRVIEAHPLFGIGWSEFIAQAADWVRQAPNYPITAIHIEVHNVFLGRAAELGLIGAALFVLCLLAGPVAAVFRRGPAHEPGQTNDCAPDRGAWRIVMLGTGIVWLSAALVSPLPYPLPNSLLWLVAGITSAGYISRPAAGRAASPPLAVVDAGRDASVS